MTPTSCWELFSQLWRETFPEALQSLKPKIEQLNGTNLARQSAFRSSVLEHGGQIRFGCPRHKASERPEALFWERHQFSLPRSSEVLPEPVSPNSWISGGRLSERRSCFGSGSAKPAAA
jgi:hypothetical protein